MKSEIDLYVMDKVRERRNNLNMSQAKLASKLKISVSFLARIEIDNYPAHYNIKHLNELAKILACSPKDFFPFKPL